MATILPKKPIGKKPRSAIEAADVPIQFGVPSEAATSFDAVPAPFADTPDLDVAIADMIDSADDAVVEVVASAPVDVPDGEPEPMAAAVVPVALDVAPVEAAPIDMPSTAPVAALPTAPEPITASPPTPAPEPLKGPTMDETTNTTNAAGMMNGATEAMKTAASDMQARGTAMMGDMNGRAKSAMERGTKAVEELVEFQKGNLEALMTSGRVASNGAQEIAKYSAEYGRSTIEKANATARQFAAVKSPTEFFQLQGEIAKQTLDALVAEGAKFTDSYMKLMGEVTQPLSNRVAVAVDKAKTTMGNQG